MTTKRKTNDGERPAARFPLCFAPVFPPVFPPVFGLLFLAAGICLMTSACGKEAPKAPPPAAEPVKAPAPAPSPPAGAAAISGDAGVPPKPKMVANADGLSLADRIAKRQAAEAKVAAELAAEENQRLLKYDRAKLPQHKQVFAFIVKTRAQYDGAKKAGDKAKLDKLRDSLQKPIAATAKKMATIDPKGGNSNVTTDYDVMLNALANDYPAAIAASLEGDKQPLVDQTAELDKREKKVADWLTALKSAKK
jgi:hypothetical protein